MNRPYERPLLGEAKLNAQAALWGAVTPELRWVLIKVDSRSVSGRFVFDVEPTEELREIVDDAETEVIADYGGLTPVTFTSEYLPREQPLTLGPDEHLVFLRREPPTALPEAVDVAAGPKVGHPPRSRKMDRQGFGRLQRYLSRHRPLREKRGGPHGSEKANAMNRPYQFPPLGQAKLYVQAALFGAVTPELRGVSIKVDSQSVSGRFVFDVEPTEELREIVDDAETEVLADYGGLTPVAFTSEYLPREQRLTLGPDEHWVFRRREPPTAL